MNELRYAVRSLLRTPAFTVVVALSLAVGIGATTTAFTWIDTFLLNPLAAVPDSRQLVSVYTKGPQDARWSISYPRFKDWHAAGAPFDRLALYSGQQFSLKTDGFGPERVFGEVVSGNYFDVMQVRATSGRTFNPDEEAAAAQVVVISERLWDRVFQRNPAAVGRTIAINSNSFTVVGVVPAKFGGSMVGVTFDFWVPVTTIPVLDPGNQSLSDDGWQWLEGVMRRPASMTLAQVEAAATAVSQQVAQSKGEQVPTLAGVRTLAEQGAGPIIKPLFLTLFGLAAIILLIACANIANLLLVRAIKRGKETSLRLALGANRGRIVRQLLTESLVLAIVGGAGGVLLASYGRRLIDALMPSLPYPVNLSGELNVRVVLLASLVTIGTAVLVGLLPAIRASNPSLVGTMKEQMPGGRRSWLRSALVVAQVSLSLIALVAAGLFLRSLNESRSANVGFSKPEQVLVAGTSFQFAGMNDSVAALALLPLLERIRTIPGVASVSVANDLPMSLGGHSSSYLEPEGYQAGRDENMSVEYGVVGPQYFQTMGISLVKGRDFAVTDQTGSPGVVVVNEAFAKKYWPTREALGAQIRQGGRTRTVVGVAPQVVMQSLGEPSTPYIYYPMSQRFESEFSLVIRTQGAPRLMIEPVRAALQSVSPSMPLLDPQTMLEHSQGALFVQSTGAKLLSALGLLALGLAAIGLYGVLSFSVGQRSREIGIRMALGAETGRVVKLVVGQAAWLVAIGAGIGAGLALVVANLLRSQLFGVSPADPTTFAAVLAVLALVALLAASIPARRAARVDPVVTLKTD